MFKNEIPDKVSINVIAKGKQFFAEVGFDQTHHSLGPTESREEIYRLIFNFIHDIRIIAETENE